MTTNEKAEGTGMAKRAKSAALTVKDWMEQPTMNSSLAAALSGYMSIEFFAAQCYLAAQDPKLAQCSAESLFRGFLDVAGMGLVPGAAHKHVAMVPRNGIITVQPQWQGIKFLLERQPGVERVQPYLVHVTDEFEADRDTVRVHKFDPFNPARIFEHPDVAAKAGRPFGLRGGYTEIVLTSGEVRHHFVPVAKMEKNRACAKTQDFWQRWPEEMYLKTCIRDVFAKRVIAISPQIATRMDAVERADNLALGNDPGRTAPQLAPKSRTQGVAALLGVGEDVPDMTRVPIDATGEAVEATIDPPTA